VAELTNLATPTPTPTQLLQPNPATPTPTPNPTDWKKEGVNFNPLGEENRIFKPPKPHNPVGKSVL